MISKTAEYALRAVVHLAALQSPEDSQTVGQIAEKTSVPAGYLAKVLQGLARGGIITSQRGLGGGFRIARGAGAISVYEVIQAVAPLGRIRECPLGLEAHGTHLCLLHKRLDEAMALLEGQFRATTIAELLATPEVSGTAGSICEFPSAAGTGIGMGCLKATGA